MSLLGRAPWRTHVWEVRSARLRRAIEREEQAAEGDPIYEMEPALPGHCPVCHLDYQLARLVIGRREVSDHCAICEAEEGRR